jgi:thiol-disulfide isomerase/thioredoxin
MKRMVRNALLTIFFLGISTAPAFALDPPQVGGRLPDVTLPAPEDPDHRAYLGLVAEESTFTIPDIASPVIIIEIFSMYCPHCQREAPVVNRLYRLIQESPDLKGKVKLIGIGVGNTRFEVDYFKKTYEIPFPLFPDPDFAIHALMGEVRTPYFVVVRNQEEGGHRVIHSELGGFGEPAAFLDLIRQKSELQ